MGARPRLVHAFAGSFFSHPGYVLGLGFATALACSAPRAYAAAVPGDVVITPFGSTQFVANPTWKPADFVFFSAPLASVQQFQQVQQQIFPKHVQNDIGLIPGPAHAGPYDTEVTRGVQAAGYVAKQVFTVSEFTGTHGVYLDWVLIPTAAGATGSSADFASGPIIPNSIFTILFDGRTLRNATLFDPNWGPQYWPATTDVNPPVPGQGYSHMPYVTGEQFEFQDTPNRTTDPTGLYTHQFTVGDAQGNGWNIEAPFSVVPEPAALLTLALALAPFTRHSRRRTD